MSISWPSWSGDGKSLAYHLTNLIDGAQSVESLDIDSAARSLVVEGGSSPSMSTDGRSIAYVHQVARRWSIWNVDRSTGSKRQLVSEAWFDDADVPSYSPDSSIIGFVAVGAGPPAGTGGFPLAALLAGFAPTASAHDIEGAVFDLWSVRPDGSDLRRVAALANEQPFIAWSPDGRHMAVWGGVGLQIVDVTSGGTRLLRNPVGTGPISWGH
jgi:Tol biopolymer transport system component